MEKLDLGSKLTIQPGFETLISLKSTAFLTKRIQIGESRVVICECNIVMLSSKSRYRGWSPNIGSNDVADITSMFPHTLFCNRLASCLAIHTRFTKGAAILGVIEDETTDQPSVSELVSYRRGNVPKTVMQFHNGEPLSCSICSIMIPDNTIQPPGQSRDAPDCLAIGAPDSAETICKGGGEPELIQTAN